MLMFVVLAILCFFCFWRLSVTKPRNFPPGPSWRPLVGSQHCLKAYTTKYGGQHLALRQLAKEYNSPILGFKLGEKLVVTAEDYPTIKEILTNEDYNQRTHNFFIKLRNMNKYIGVTLAEGTLWNEQRNFTSRHLRNVGMGKDVMNERIHDEVHNLFRIIDSNEVVQMSKYIPFVIINSLWVLIAGQQINKETFKENKLLDIMRRRSKAFDLSGGTIGQFPWLRFIIPERSGYNLIKRLNKELKEFLSLTIAEHHETWTLDNSEDFIYRFISEMERQKDNSTTFTDEQLLYVCLDLFLGGFTTTSNTLDFVILFLLLHQEVQRKAQKELDATFDTNHPIEYIDRHKVPYVQAVLKEVLRYSNIQPVVGLRRTIKDTTLAGYTIPNGTTILLNMYPMFMDKKIWGDPETFRPERFLDENGEHKFYPEYIPFGLGKRKCLGDAFAKGCIFIITAELLRNYNILPVDPEDLPSTEPVPGLVLSPKPYFANYFYMSKLLSKRGPSWRPLIGSVNCLREYSIKYGGQHFALHELSKKWKSAIVGFKLGQELMVAVEDYDIAKEILTRDEFCERPQHFFAKLRNMGTLKGVTFARGKFWAEQRSFTVRHLRNVGMGKDLMNVKIQEEIQNLFKVIDESDTVQISQYIPFAIIRILWGLIAGSKVNKETFQQNQLLNVMSRRSKAFDMSGGLLSQFPILRFIIPERSGYTLIQKLNREMKDFIMKTIEEHQRTWTPNNRNDFIYSFISEMKLQNGASTTFTDDQLLLICVDLFIAGFTTISSTLDYVILFLLLHQNVQVKVQKVLDANFERNCPIQYNDRHRVPYIEAVLMEAMRCGNVQPIVGVRSNVKETTLAGYTIPKDTTVLLNLYPIFMNKKIWGDPETFRPERFIDKDGQLMKFPEFIPFSLGKRKCLGDDFAKGCLFVITSEILRNYTILPIDSSNNLPSTIPVPGIVLTTRPYYAKFIRR
ncbi:hypothetical protein FQA39_LY17503 [Lamprigera yunnana]|nr:hypothetical protein FQA39_LY17503 [Lamprigera yunnana]